MALYFYQLTGNSLSMVTADGKASLITGADVSLEDVSSPPSPSLTAHAETFWDVPENAGGYALPYEVGFPNHSLLMEWDLGATAATRAESFPDLSFALSWEL